MEVVSLLLNRCTKEQRTGTLKIACIEALRTGKRQKQDTRRYKQDCCALWQSCFNGSSGIAVTASNPFPTYLFFENCQISHESNRF